MKYARASVTVPSLPTWQKTSPETLALAGDLLPLCDFIGLLLAGYASTQLAPAGSPLAASSGLLWGGIQSVALLAAVLAPFILCDRGFAAAVRDGRGAALLRCYAIRFVMFAGVVLGIGAATGALARLPSGWITGWLAASIAVTAATRLLLARHLRRLQHLGRLTPVIAVVGAGPMADRFIQHLRRGVPAAADIVDVFDDRADRGALCKATGSIAALVELGTRRNIDWIVLCLPATAELRVQAIVHRLKALAAPIALCPSGQAIDGAGALLPVARPADPPVALPGAPRPFAGFGSVFNVMPGAMFAPMRAPASGPGRASRTAKASAMLGEALAEFLPRWIVRLLRMPAALLSRPRHAPRRLTLKLDGYDVAAFTQVATRFGHGSFGYAVTPNADHLLRLHQDSRFRGLYADASYVLLDSRFLANLWRRARGVRLPVCTGADLVENLFGHVILPDDGVVLVGGSDAQAALLKRRYGLDKLAHFNPPMGFIGRPAAVATALAFIESHSPFRFCFLAVGSPQQEILAQALKVRGKARGLALCLGASIDFLTGAERRAPRWLQRAGFEWAFRLLQAPRRMAHRYLVRGPRLLALLGRTDIVVRAPVSAPVSAPASAVVPPPEAHAGTIRPSASNRYTPSSQPCPNRISA